MDEDELDEDELDEDELELDVLSPPQPPMVSTADKQALAIAHFAVNTLFILSLSLIVDDFLQKLPVTKHCDARMQENRSVDNQLRIQGEAYLGKGVKNVLLIMQYDKSCKYFVFGSEVRASMLGLAGILPNADHHQCRESQQLTCSGPGLHSTPSGAPSF